MEVVSGWTPTESESFSINNLYQMRQMAQGKERHGYDMQEKGSEKKFRLKFTKDQFLIVLLMGILLMVIVWPVEDKNKKTETKSGQWDSESAILNQQSNLIQSSGTGQSVTQEEDALLFYASCLERSLEELLGTMDGVGKVRVMVTLASSGEAVVEKDVNTVRQGTTEVDSAGGSRNTTNINDSEETIYQDGQQGNGAPYVKKVLSPRVEGVVVSAQGGGNLSLIPL
ncbi:MAG: hypothetical protein K2N55_03410, partial [Lachnospiraceae bacterium]|nr:hypothetical protein [Lachnospiraceae bacterium]